MRDTLLCYTDLDLAPLYFRKGAREGDRYYVDELWYTYPNSNCHLKMHRIDHDGEVHWKDAEYKDCIYDMMSIFLRARNFDISKLSVGENIPMPISDASRLTNSWLKYTGKTTLKMKNNNDKYRCLTFSFIEREDGQNHEPDPFLYHRRQESHACPFGSFPVLRLCQVLSVRIQGTAQPHGVES